MGINLGVVVAALVVVGPGVARADVQADPHRVVERATARVEPSRRQLLQNMSALLVAARSGKLVTLPESKRSDLVRLLDAKQDLAVDKVTDLLKIVVGKAIGETAGAVVAGVFHPTDTSVCSELNCKQKMEPTCAQRLLADTQPEMFRKIVADPVCTARLLEALK